MSIHKLESISSPDPDLACYHCGEVCEQKIWLNDKVFCCQGCSTVYEILQQNDLCEYYGFDKTRGAPIFNEQKDYSFLDEEAIRRQVIEFDSRYFAKVILYIPNIHCISCVWLLENLHRIKEGILHASVNFTQKTVSLDFNPEKIKLGEIASLLASVGYAPRIHLEKNIPKKFEYGLVARLAVAGFCFGNIMLLSFPEYLGISTNDEGLHQLFSWINVVLALPVILYSASPYYISTIKSFKLRQITIDVPITIGLVALFLRSLWEISSTTGPGYLDSLAGLVFFLLIGRWFQDKTYESLAFDRDFKSYFPLAVQRQTQNGWKPVIICDLQEGDLIQVRNNEVIPADCELMDDEAHVDYSFVTGESKPIQITRGELVYAGGKLLGGVARFVILKKTSQSHLTSLWNSPAFQKENSKFQSSLIDKVSKIFTWTVLALAIVTSIYWYFKDPSQVWLVVTAVLIVACPCALALAYPFTYGNLLRIFGRKEFYLKNAEVIEMMGRVDVVIFDKTGTVTHGKSPDIEFVGQINDDVLMDVKLLASYSTHPLSNLIARSIPGNRMSTVDKFVEYPGKGIEGLVGGKLVQLGSPAFVGSKRYDVQKSSLVFVSIDKEILGYFEVKTELRDGIKEMLSRLGDRYLVMLSGDNGNDKPLMESIFPSGKSTLLFNQSPHDKLKFVEELQAKGMTVMMVGDGLNDAGALQQSNVGIAVTDDTGVFTPACDGIIKGDRVGELDSFFSMAGFGRIILMASFGISFLYNAVAISIAMMGLLTPIFAAILMPLSSVSVVAFASIAVSGMTNSVTGRLRSLKLNR